MARLGKGVSAPAQGIPSPQLILETDYSAVQKTDPSALQKSDPENASAIQSSDQGAAGILDLIDIKVQITYIVKFLVDNHAELDNYNLEKLVHLMLDLLIQNANKTTLITDPKQ